MAQKVNGPFEMRGRRPLPMGAIYQLQWALSLWNNGGTRAVYCRGIALGMKDAVHL